MRKLIFGTSKEWRQGGFLPGICLQSHFELSLKSRSQLGKNRAFFLSRENDFSVAEVDMLGMEYKKVKLITKGF